MAFRYLRVVLVLNMARLASQWLVFEDDVLMKRLSVPFLADFRPMMLRGGGGHIEEPRPWAPIDPAKLVVLPDDFESLQFAALSTAQGGCIYLRSGTYYNEEQVDIREGSSLDIIGHVEALVTGRWQLFERSVGRWFGVSCKHVATHFLDHCILIEGGTQDARWSVEECSIRCDGGIAVRCVHDSHVSFSRCSLGGFLPVPNGRLKLPRHGGADALSCRDTSDTLLVACHITDTGTLNHAARFTGSARGQLVGCEVERVGIGVAVDEDAQVLLRACKLTGQRMAALRAGPKCSSASRVELQANTVSGMPWIGPKRPGAVEQDDAMDRVEREWEVTVAELERAREGFRRDHPELLRRAMAEAATNTTVFDELIQDWGNFGPLPEPELDEESTLGWRPGAGVGYQAMADRVWKMMQEQPAHLRAFAPIGVDDPDWIEHPFEYEEVQMERLAAAVKLQDEEGDRLLATLEADRRKIEAQEREMMDNAEEVIKLATSEQKIREDDDVDSSALDEGFAAAVASLGGVGAGGEKAWGDASGSEEVSEEDGLSELFDDGEGGEEDPAMQKWREIFDVREGEELRGIEDDEEDAEEKVTTKDWSPSPGGLPAYTKADSEARKTESTATKDHGDSGFETAAFQEESNFHTEGEFGTQTDERRPIEAEDVHEEGSWTRRQDAGALGVVGTSGRGIDRAGTDARNGHEASREAESREEESREDGPTAPPRVRRGAGIDEELLGGGAAAAAAEEEEEEEEEEAFTPVKSRFLFAHAPLSRP